MVLEKTDRGGGLGCGAGQIYILASARFVKKHQSGLMLTDGSNLFGDFLFSSWHMYRYLCKWVS